MGRGIGDFYHKYLLAGAGIYDIKLIKLRAGSWFWREVGPATLVSGPDLSRLASLLYGQVEGCALDQRYSWGERTKPAPTGFSLEVAPNSVRLKRGSPAGYERGRRRR